MYKRGGGGGEGEGGGGALNTDDERVCVSGMCVCMGEGGVGGLSHDHHSHTRSVLLVGAVLVDLLVSMLLMMREFVCLVCVCVYGGGGSWRVEP